MKKKKEKKAKGLKAKLKAKIILKRILKPTKMTVRIKEHEPTPYVSRFFKNEWEEAKQSMFFK
ncbi:MAG TPA: hypothetical protein VMV95_02915 [Bacillota bacterium]|nr:hypothetical protein [Bacillota bacterium]